METGVVLICVLQNTSDMDTGAARGPCSDVTHARVLDTCVTLHVYIHLQQLLVNVCLIEADIHGVAGGHHVVVVHDLNKEDKIMITILQK